MRLRSSLRALPRLALGLAPIARRLSALAPAGLDPDSLGATLMRLHTRAQRRARKAGR
ncbi:hypothetical protein [Luteitalea sp.]|uniref:hypothetical protein n=1 Tax=Luteitalea sp. TaxID=2004800 RepID=UPI0037C81FDF